MKQEQYLYDSYYTIQVLHKGQLEWYSLDGYLSCNKETKVSSLEQAKDLIAKIDYPCHVRVIQVTKNIVEKTEIKKPDPLTRKELLELIVDMPTLRSGCYFYQVQEIEHSTTGDKFGRCPTEDKFKVVNLQTGVITTLMFNKATIIDGKLRVFNICDQEYFFDILKPIKLK